MATQVVMPQMGYDMQEGTLVRWLKQEGDQVSRGEAIAEIETDKAVVEVEAFDSGVLRVITAQEGTTVPVGVVIAVIGKSGEKIPAELLKRAGAVEAKAQQTSVVAEEAPAVAAETAPASAPTKELRASPHARRRAGEKGIDLSQVNGTGPGGRITKDDVLAYESRASAAPSKPAPTRATAPAVAPPTPEGKALLSSMRQAVARLTARAKREIPHFYVTAEIDMTQVLELRRQLNQARKDQRRISVNDLIVKAAALALAKHPLLNAFFEEGHLRMNPQVNIGIVVSVKDGLLVPAVTDCVGRSIDEIAKASRDLVERAKGSALTPEEYAGGTFSISNMGMYDVDNFAAIIYPPQSAMLAVGTIRKQPVVRREQIAIAQVMKTTLSVDHRVADGAQAAQLLSEIKRFLENPVLLLDGPK